MYRYDNWCHPEPCLQGAWFRGSPLAWLDMSLGDEVGAKVAMLGGTGTVVATAEQHVRMKVSERKRGSVCMFYHSRAHL